jgi:PAS domain S-box-containing protein
MQLSWRRVSLWCLAGLAFLAGLGAAYLALRGTPPNWSTWAGIAVGCLVASSALAAALIAAWITHRFYSKSLRDLGRHVREMKTNPTSLATVSFDADVEEVSAQIEALSTSYRQALAELVKAREQLDTLESLQGRADAETGRSHSLIIRGGVATTTSRRSMVGRLTPTLHWIGSTPALQQAVGFGNRELNGKPFMDLVHPADGPNLARSFQEALETGEGHNVTCRVRTRAGEEKHMQMDILTRYTDSGAPLHLRCHFLDITEKVKTEQELRRRAVEIARANERLQRTNEDLERLKESYRDLYHQAPVMYFSLDTQGLFAACNDKMRQALGYYPEKLFAQPYTRILAPESRLKYQHNSSVYQRAGEIETKWIRKDGTIMDVWIRNETILDDQGRFIRSRSVAQDVTERTRLEDALRTKANELQQANGQLRRINRELDDFTYVVSHDLKEPLRTLQAFSNFLSLDYGDVLGAEGHDYINHLMQASKRLGSLIDDLLTLSRAGRIIKALRPFDLLDAVQTVKSDLADLIQRKAAIVRVDGPLPAVAADRERVIQLLTNLVSNGLKYNTTHPPEVVIGWDQDGVAGARLADTPIATKTPSATLYVRDNGIGIDPCYHDQIFRIFRRLHRREEYEGTGAGLAICKKIVEAHGGRIWVESQAGSGATFYFTLPQAPQADEASAAPAARAVVPKIDHADRPREIEPTSPLFETTADHAATSVASR